MATHSSFHAIRHVNVYSTQPCKDFKAILTVVILVSGGIEKDQFELSFGSAWTRCLNIYIYSACVCVCPLFSFDETMI
jgi:hypothetical protein